MLKKKIKKTLLEYTISLENDVENESYQGHTLYEADFAMETSKIEVVQNSSQPVSIKQLWGFLGLTRYYIRFIKGYVGIAVPLLICLKKFILMVHANN